MFVPETIGPDFRWILVAVTPLFGGSMCIGFCRSEKEGKEICENLLFSNRVHLGVRNKMRGGVIRSLLRHRILVEV